MMSSRTVAECALIGMLVFNAGCASFWHEFKPHRLQRLNRGPAPSLDPEFIHYKRKSQTGLVKKIPPSRSATLSANSAEIVTLRAQSDAE